MSRSDRRQGQAFYPGEAERLRELCRENPGRFWRAVTVLAMIRLGWSPPTPTDAQADRILEDMYPSGDTWGERRMVNGVPPGAREQGHDREKRLPANATIVLGLRHRTILAMVAAGKQQPARADLTPPNGSLESGASWAPTPFERPAGSARRRTPSRCPP